MATNYVPTATELARAWREAVRCWHEYRAFRRDHAKSDPLMVEMLRVGAESADTHYRHLRSLLPVTAERVADALGESGACSDNECGCHAAARELADELAEATSS